eukprot:TRINITY_DN9165_c0_g2_i2.p1 TRINITY_DN9165_c0_g2~~TRINITY_DN9165_c0_g2_i2.p1  ORF type:complete len:248 (+),score=49.94 TRINITY_DN9165_c0_g2_i2:96-839(+)
MEGAPLHQLHTFVPCESPSTFDWGGGLAELSSGAADARERVAGASPMSDEPYLRGKVVLCGAADTGKTSLLQRAAHNVWDRKYRMTIGVDFATLRYRALGVPLDLSVWDTAGEERFSAAGMRPQYYRDADAVVIVYDVSEPASFESIARHWLPDVRKYIAHSTPVFLVGQKDDLVARVSWDEAEAFAAAERLELWAASALENRARGPPRIRPHRLHPAGAAAERGHPGPRFAPARSSAAAPTPVAAG